jgi:hypothetical protein
MRCQKQGLSSFHEKYKIKILILEMWRHLFWCKYNNNNNNNNNNTNNNNDFIFRLEGQVVEGMHWQ